MAQVDLVDLHRAVETRFATNRWAYKQDFLLDSETNSKSLTAFYGIYFASATRVLTEGNTPTPVRPGSGWGADVDLSLVGQDGPSGHRAAARRPVGPSYPRETN